VWGALAVVTLALPVLAPTPPEGPLTAVWTPPDWLRPDLAGAISRAMAWLTAEARIGPVAFTDVTRALAATVEAPYELVRNLLVEGWTEGRGRRAEQLFPPLSWIAVIALVVAIGVHARGWRLGLFAGGCFLYLAVFGQWESAMVTLASVVIAVPVGVAGGLALGTLAWASRTVDRLLTPVLDLMQTVPTFAYLVPILFLFGFGPVAALVATIIYAMPPMVRVTTLALRRVPPEIAEYAVMAGCTPRQRLARVMLPAALPDLMVGVNQVIMLTLNMVIIASMIGAGGLGYDVLNALRRLDIGGGIEAGLAIVALALALDRLSQAMAERARRARPAPAGPWVRRHPLALAVGAVAVLTGLLGLAVPALQTYPEALTVSTRGFWAELVRWINVTYFDSFEAAKGAVLTHALLPIKRFLLALPWAWVLFLATLAGWRLGGLRLAALCFALVLYLAATGLWEQAMTTVYLCGVSVVLAMLIGLPLGILAAASPLAGRILGALTDTLQTLPSFVYLIPVVMLFRVGDFTAMIAVTLYALAPAIRYTAHGVASVAPELVEAGTVAGCTRWQILTRIRLPMAAPEILLGLNQTIMLALSMLVITALVGTRDLGQEVYIALTRADVGAGIVAGLAVAAIAIVADRLIAAAARAQRARLGLLEEGQ
jgi:glycine betaine/proline transport system permease protein